jgi:hypothetical protein
MFLPTTDIGYYNKESGVSSQRFDHVNQVSLGCSHDYLNIIWLQLLLVDMLFWFVHDNVFMILH